MKFSSSLQRIAFIDDGIIMCISISTKYMLQFIDYSMLNFSYFGQTITSK